MDTMRYRILGPSGIRVSELCLGTMSFGEAWGFGADEEESHRILKEFAEAGGNFVDTANAYHDGQSEEILGRFLQADRDFFVVASKYTLAMRPGDPNAAGNSRKNLRRSVEASLRRLQTDYLDVLWVHAWDYTTGVEEVMHALDDLVRAGTVNAVGLSDTPAWLASQANAVAQVRGWTPFCALQFPYSLLERSVERELLPVAASLDVAVTAWAPLAAGILTGKYTRAQRPSAVDSLRAPGNQHLLTEHDLGIAREVDFVADDLGVASAQVALAWTRQRDPRVVPIVGVRTTAQMHEALGSLEVRLSEEHLRQLDEVSRVELGFPYTLLAGPQGGMVYGDLAPVIELSPQAPIRWASAAV
jgi:aryl-alcohol dehydrogenase-like predicted oxidoreductase